MMTKSDLTAEMLVLLEEFQRSGVRELHVRSGDFELFLSNDANSAGRLASPHAAPPPPASATQTAAAAPVAKQASAITDLPEGAMIITAPNLGTFYRSPKPGAAPYVELGSIIAVGDELCLIEVMKLFTAVRANSAGRVHAILVEDGAMVEAGQKLFAVVAA